MSTLNEEVLAHAVEVLKAEAYNPETEQDPDYGYQYSEHIDSVLARKLAKAFPDTHRNVLLRHSSEAKRTLRKPAKSTRKKTAKKATTSARRKTNTAASRLNQEIIAHAVEVLEAAAYSFEAELDPDYGYQYSEHIDGLLAKKLAKAFPDTHANTLLQHSSHAKRSLRKPKEPTKPKPISIALKVTVTSLEVSEALKKRSPEWLGEMLTAALAAETSA